MYGFMNDADLVPDERNDFLRTHPIEYAVTRHDNEVVALLINFDSSDIRYGNDNIRIAAVSLKLSVRVAKGTRDRQPAWVDSNWTQILLKWIDLLVDSKWHSILIQRATAQCNPLFL